jgi:hypothetical protein
MNSRRTISICQGQLKLQNALSPWMDSYIVSIDSEYSTGGEGVPVTRTVDRTADTEESKWQRLAHNHGTASLMSNARMRLLAGYNKVRYADTLRV